MEREDAVAVAMDALHQEQMAAAGEEQDGEEEQSWG
jgi:hypothetical protein